MKVCLDIDDTITYAPDLFSMLSSIISGEVIVVTFRTDYDEAQATLKEHQIRWDRLIVSNDPQDGKRTGEGLAEWKARVVNEIMPAWFFEDMPEVVRLIHPDIKVFMPCDEVIREWIARAIDQPS